MTSSRVLGLPQSMVKRVDSWVRNVKSSFFRYYGVGVSTFNYFYMIGLIITSNSTMQ